MPEIFHIANEMILVDLVTLSLSQYIGYEKLVWDFEANTIECS